MQNAHKCADLLTARPLPARWLRAMEYIEEGEPNEIIAIYCKVHAQTVARWKRMPRFKAELAARQTQREAEQVERMRHLLFDSVKALSEALQPNHDIALRVNVARHVLTLSKLTNLHELHVLLPQANPPEESACIGEV